MSNDHLVPVRAKVADELGNNRADYLVSTLKAAARAVPVVGNAIAEILTVTIPAQRIDRVADVVRQLAERVAQTEADLSEVQARFQSKEFTDVFEETVFQAARALSEERRAHLASLLFKGLTDEELDHARVKKLLFILDDLLDQEVIWLTCLNLGIGEEADEFLQAHAHVLESVTATTIGAPQDDLDEAALQEAYRHRLEQLGLVENVDSVTPLGRLLLRYIDAPGGGDEDQSDDAE